MNKDKIIIVCAGPGRLSDISELIKKIECHDSNIIEIKHTQFDNQLSMISCLKTNHRHYQHFTKPYGHNR